MRIRTRTRALAVVAATTVAAGVVAGVSSGAFGVQGGQRFVSSPNQARFGRLPAAISSRSASQCPEGGSAVQVSLVQGASTLASASTVADVKGRWAVSMSVPANLSAGVYSVTASCTGVTAGLTYRPQAFRVIPPSCGPEPTTSTTAKCRPVLPPTGANGAPGVPGADGSAVP